MAVGVFSAAFWVRAKIVAATTVPTSLGEAVGTDGADPMQAVVNKASEIIAIIGRKMEFSFIRISPSKFPKVYLVFIMARLIGLLIQSGHAIERPNVCLASCVLDDDHHLHLFIFVFQ
jgi:hypothetical protein